MKRYDFDENENDNSKDDYDDFSEEEGDFIDDDDEDDDEMQEHDFLENEEMLRELEISFQEAQNKQKTISQAIKICSQSFFWRFYSNQTKLKMIEQCYYGLTELGN
jgi:hypothetical protein